MENEKSNIQDILLVEDDPLDVELTLTALEEHGIGNRVVVVSDGGEALDCDETSELSRLDGGSQKARLRLGGNHRFASSRIRVSRKDIS
jgi:hypothetical protein